MINWILYIVIFVINTYVPPLQAGVASTENNKRYTCNIHTEADFTSENLVKCWREIASGQGTRIYASRK